MAFGERLDVEVAAAVVEAIGADKVGIRLSPGNPLHDIAEEHLDATYQALIPALADLGLVYVHVMESAGQRDLTRTLRAAWPGAFILNPSTHPRPTGVEELPLAPTAPPTCCRSAACSWPTPISRRGSPPAGPFNSPDRATSFGGDHRGYTDYPRLTEQDEAA